MGFFKNFFKKKVEEPVIEEIEEDQDVCEFCGLGIFKEQKVRTFNKKKYHLLCFRKLWKETRQTMFK